MLSIVRNHMLEGRIACGSDMIASDAWDDSIKGQNIYSWVGCLCQVNYDLAENWRSR